MCKVICSLPGQMVSKLTCQFATIFKVTKSCNLIMLLTLVWELKGVVGWGHGVSRLQFLVIHLLNCHQ